MLIEERDGVGERGVSDPKRSLDHARFAEHVAGEVEDRVSTGPNKPLRVMMHLACKEKHRGHIPSLAPTPHFLMVPFIAGERDCPPEDCGGIPGFYEMLEARADPAHPDHSEISEWLDEYDPDVLDVFPIQVALDRIAARRNAATKRIINPANN